MGNNKLNKYNPQGKQNNQTQKSTQKTIQRGKLSICYKQSKNGHQIYFIIFQSSRTSDSKIIKWKRGQFQIIDLTDDQLATIRKIQDLGEFAETEVIDAIKWSSTGAFASKKSSTSNEWCQSVCWKLGKKINLV